MKILDLQHQAIKTTMKILLIVAVIVWGTSALPSLKLHNEWDSFKANHNKNYDLFEEQRRLDIFKSNLEKIEQHNELYRNGEATYGMAVNQFADWTSEEFVQFLNGSVKFSRLSRSNRLVERFSQKEGVEAPNSIDWRSEGAVTEVKNQLTCGSCWTFSATGSLEGQNFIKNNKLVSLSEQELVDCAGGIYENQGCNGGFMNTAFLYVMDNGLTSEKDYPYEGKDRKCRRSSKKEAVRAKGYVQVDMNDEEGLQVAVGTIGPVSVAVDASYWQFYAQGVYSDKYCSSNFDDLNHGVLAVGYGSDKGEDYWTVKNSWGSIWGEEGYIRVTRGKNICGIATDASFPKL